MPPYHAGGVFSFRSPLPLQVITSVLADSFAGWEGDAFEPEAQFLEAIKAIDGIDQVGVREGSWHVLCQGCATGRTM